MSKPEKFHRKFIVEIKGRSRPRGDGRFTLMEGAVLEILKMAVTGLKDRFKTLKIDLQEEFIKGVK